MTALGDVIAFVTVSDAPRAAAFYRDLLGLTLVEESPYALVFDINGTMLRVAVADDVTPAPGTVVGWQVDDMAAAVETLAEVGVDFAIFEGMPQDDRGVWTAPGGDHVAWFRDPDGNVLSITEFVAG